MDHDSEQYTIRYLPMMDLLTTHPAGNLRLHWGNCVITCKVNLRHISEVSTEKGAQLAEDEESFSFFPTESSFCWIEEAIHCPLLWYLFTTN
jgi:hypothetical protein